MNKTELIAAMAEASGLSKKDRQFAPAGYQELFGHTGSSASGRV